MQVRAILPRSYSIDELASYILPEDGAPLREDGQKLERALLLQCSDLQKELMDARSLIEAMESKQLGLIEELEFMQNENNKLREMLHNQQNGESEHRPEPRNCNQQNSFVLAEDLNLVTEGENDTTTLILQAKLDKLSKDLKDASLLNSQYLEDHAMGMSQNYQAELIQEEVEIETARTILHLQEEIATLQSELQGRIQSLAEENRSLRNCVAEKDSKMKALCSDWERATLELTTFLMDGSKSLRDASSHIKSITRSFPCDNVWISEHVERAAKLCVEKEESILLLKRSLEDAQKTVSEMDHKLISLRGATMALSEVQQIKHLEPNLVYNEGPITEDERYAHYNFLEMKREFHQPMMVLRDNVEKDAPLTDATASVSGDVNVDIELACYRLLEAENIIKLSCLDAENHFTSLQSDIHEAFSIYKELIQGLVNDIHDLRRNFVKVMVNYGSVQIHTAGSPLVHSHRFLEHENEHKILHQIRDELTEINERLNLMSACFSGIAYASQPPSTAENLEEANGWTTDFSTSSSNSSADSVPRSEQIALSHYDQYLKKKTAQILDLQLEECSIVSTDCQELEHSRRRVQSLSFDQLTLFCLRKEFKAAYDAFIKISDQLTALFRVKDTWDGSASSLVIPDLPLFATNKEQHFVWDENKKMAMPEKGVMVQSHDEITQTADAGCSLTREVTEIDI